MTGGPRVTRSAAHPGRVVAVIGDGALTGGMAYEALNHAGHLHTPLLVVLNDNAMSIEKNVGAMSTYLSRIRTDPTLYRFRRDLERRLSRLPAIGEGLAAMGAQLKDSIKAAIVPGMLFEDLGFTYVGVIDGHDIEELRASIRRSLAIDGPVLLHCRTVKGKGYAPAEQEPDRYHGTPRFSVTTGESLDPEGPTTFTRAFGEAMVELAAADPRVIGITAAMAAGTGLDLLKEALPERCLRRGHRRGACGRVSPRVSRRRACARSSRSTRRSCRGPTTKSSKTSVCSACPWSSPSTVRASWGRTGPRITAPSISHS